MAASSSSSESSAYSKVKLGFMLDKEGYIKHSEDMVVIEHFLKFLEDPRLINYVTYDYKTIHSLDAIEFFVNARLAKTEDAIRSIVNGTEVTILHGDIKAFFEFLVREGEKPDCSGHAYNQDAI
nr:uncharacterized protein LOC109167327 [Ipomoea batatas]